MTFYKTVGWMIGVGEALIVANLFALLVGALAKRLRRFSAGLLFASTQYWALALTVWCAAAVYSGWGWVWTLIGLLLGIVGIIPVALILLLVNRQWFDIVELLFQAVLVCGGYLLSARMMRQDHI